MKRTMILAVVLMVASAAHALPALNVEIVYPTPTTWQLWGNMIDNTAGLASYAISVSGITTKTNKSPTADLYDEESTKIGSIGFAAGDDVVQGTNQYQLFKYQSTAAPESLIYGVGVVAQTITSWPGAASMLPATINIAMPALLYQGKRPTDGPVTVNYGISGANAFTQIGGVQVIEVPVIPEPATLALLALGSLAALRRRR